MLTQSLSNRSENVIVDGCRSRLGNILTGVLQGRVQSRLLLLLDISELFSILANKLTGYANDPTLFAVVSSLGIRITVAQSLNRDPESLFRFQSSFSKTWYLEEVLGTPCYCSLLELFSGFCPARLGVLLCSVVLGCSIEPCSQWCLLLSCLCV